MNFPCGDEFFLEAFNSDFGFHPGHAINRDISDSDDIGNAIHVRNIIIITPLFIISIHDKTVPLLRRM